MTGKTINDLQRLLNAQNFKSEEELKLFMNNLIGKQVPAFEKESLTPEQQAEDLVFQALESEQGEDALEIIFQALELDPECIPAYEYLGNFQIIEPLAIPYYAYGVQLGREKFQKDIREYAGELWYHPHLRPFLRCMFSYAHYLYLTGAHKKSLAVFKEILEFTKDDNLGVRNMYGLFLLEQKLFNEFEALDKSFKYEISAISCFNRLLYSFLKTGDSPETLKLLAEAKSQNKFIIGVLTARSPIGPDSLTYALGSKDEAAYYASFAFFIWQEVKGAVAFLKKNKK